MSEAIEINGQIVVKNQTQLVHELLKRGDVLTTEIAISKYGIGRLANHINELKKQGVNIQSRRINMKNMGKGKHYFEFKLATEN